MNYYNDVHISLFVFNHAKYKLLRLILLYLSMILIINNIFQLCLLIFILQFFINKFYLKVKIVKYYSPIKKNYFTQIIFN